jgi:cyclopropane-fatty-acyl-phospholipid synthase
VHGVTISPAQLGLAQQRVAAEGLQDLARLELRDYRDLRGRYDALVSIEMFEAVGQAYWRDWFATVGRLLVPGGQALVQSITIAETRFAQYRATSDFIRHFIFPGGMLPTPGRFVAGAARVGLVTRDMLAFGKDYAQTIRHWRERFEGAGPAILALGLDQPFVRLWRLYLAYCEAGFEEGRTDVFQFVLQRE